MEKKEDAATSSLADPARAPSEINNGYCLCQPEPKIPRPRNAFILYRQHQQATVVRQYPGLPNPEISKIIGEQWSKLSEDQKQRWKALAEVKLTQPRAATYHKDHSLIIFYRKKRLGMPFSTLTIDTNLAATAVIPPPQDRDRLRSPPYGGAPYDPRDPHTMSYHSPHPRHDHRYHQPYRQSISVPHQPTSVAESYGHDLKRRRFDGAGIYIPTRESPHEKTANGDGAVKPTYSQESSLAAMIMSIPVLNKIKILSTVSPSLTAPHPASPPLSIRGAIVAIDGPDMHSVWGMTNSLKMQLEREGNFVAKIFAGPDPAKFFGTGSKNAMSTADVLRLAEEWHKVSDEMRRFITTRPGSAVESEAARRTSIRGLDMLEPPETAAWSASLEATSSDVVMAEPCSATKIPDHPPFDHRPLSITSQAEEADDGGNKSKSHSHPATLSVNSLSKPSDLAIAAPSPRVTRSRSTASPGAIPGSHWQWVAALWRGAIGPDVTVAVRPAAIRVNSDEESSFPFGFADGPLSNGDERMTSAAAAKEKAANSALLTARQPQPQPQPQPPQAPGQPQGQAKTQAQANAAANGGPSWRTADGPGVEVRLLDYRAVIVRTMGKGGQPQTNGTGDGSRAERRDSHAQLKLGSDEERKAEEFWEKAKRRVGFEVAEFLRR
ncbi:hypothetical protein DV737_g4293, partial [Chaetothyriales sp. CBS 132003]